MTWHYLLFQPCQHAYTLASLARSITVSAVFFTFAASKPMCSPLARSKSYLASYGLIFANIALNMYPDVIV